LLEAVFLLQRPELYGGQSGTEAVRETPHGFVLWGAESTENRGRKALLPSHVADAEARVNHAWFRGAWFDALTLAWKIFRRAPPTTDLPVTEGGPAPGATLFVPFTLAPGESRTITLQLAWYVGQTALRFGKDPPEEGVGMEAAPQQNHKPWYAGRFADVEQVAGYWRDQYAELRQKSKRFSDCFYDTTLPPEVIEAVAANLTILKSPTVLRQTDGKLWAWEGCSDNLGCCHGSCTHVWNYAQALPHLFSRTGSVPCAKRNSDHRRMKPAINRSERSSHPRDRP